MTDEKKGAEKSPRLVSFSAVPARSAISVGGRVLSIAPATRSFAALATSDPRFLTGEFVGSAFLVSGASTFGGNRALRLRIHRRESTRSFSAHATTAACIRSAVVPTSVIRASAPRQCAVVSHGTVGAASAPLVHSFPLVVSLICHYPSPAANSSVNVCRSSSGSITEVKNRGRFPRRWKTQVRKRQAAISRRARVPRKVMSQCGLLARSHVCVSVRENAAVCLHEG